MDSSAYRYRYQNQNSRIKNMAADKNFPKVSPQPGKSPDNHANQRKKAHNVAHIFFCPFTFRHGYFGIHRKRNLKTVPQSSHLSVLLFCKFFCISLKKQRNSINHLNGTVRHTNNFLIDFPQITLISLCFCIIGNAV